MSITKQEQDHWPDWWAGRLTTEQIQKHEHRLELYRDVESDGTFHIGQCYENKAAILQECVICGCREFNVGVGDCFTAIRCKNCEWELCIHDG
jgi:hypothetical protein